MLISLLEAAHQTGVSHWRLSQLVASDKLPALSVNGFLMVHEEHLQRCLLETVTPPRLTRPEHAN